METNRVETKKTEIKRTESDLKLINMESVEVEQIEWLFYPFIPFGKVTIIQGDPGEGKTTMVLQIIAKLTKGEKILPEQQQATDEKDRAEKNVDSDANPVESPIEPVNVIYQTAEDGLGDTIKPRLLAAGADCSRVMVIDDNDRALTMMDTLLIETCHYIPKLRGIPCDGLSILLGKGKETISLFVRVGGGIGTILAAYLRIVGGFLGSTKGHDHLLTRGLLLSHCFCLLGSVPFFLIMALPPVKSTFPATPEPQIVLRLPCDEV